jgi:translation initiation factor IF-1
MPDANIQAAGKVIEALGGVLYRVELPNGKRIPAHLSKALTQAGETFTAGQRLLLELTPYDFDSARIVGALPGADSLADAETGEDRAE